MCFNDGVDCLVTQFLIGFHHTGERSIAQQRSCCTHQMKHILSRMGNAISNVKMLTLSGDHKHTKPSVLFALEGQKPGQNHQKQETSPSLAATPQPTAFLINCPSRFGGVAGSVFAMLASAVPNLQKLSLHGSCWNAALCDFGLACPQLTSLEIQVPDVPIGALLDFGKHLPSLVSIEVFSSSASHLDEVQLSAYLNSFLPMTGQCSNLATLTFKAVDRSMTLACKPDAWKLVPANLKHLTCDFNVSASESFDALIRRVPSLSLVGFPKDLMLAFQQFPVLERLYVPDQMLILDCSESSSDTLENNVVTRRSLLKNRFLNDRLSLTCQGLVLAGTSQEIEAVSVWLPTFVGSERVIYSLEGEDPPLCLEHLPRLFPHCRYLTLTGEPGGAGVWDMEVLRPVEALPNLLMLNLKSSQLAITTSGLLKLCSKLTSLVGLILEGGIYAGVDKDKLMVEIAKNVAVVIS